MWVSLLFGRWGGGMTMEKPVCQLIVTVFVYILFVYLYITANVKEQSQTITESLVIVVIQSIYCWNVILRLTCNNLKTIWNHQSIQGTWYKTPPKKFFTACTYRSQDFHNYSKAKETYCFSVEDEINGSAEELIQLLTGNKKTTNLVAFGYAWKLTKRYVTNPM